MSLPQAKESFLDPARISAQEPVPRYSHWPTWCLLVPLLLCGPILYASSMAALVGQSPEIVLAEARRAYFIEHLPASGIALALALVPLALGVFAWTRRNRGEPGNLPFVRWRYLVINYSASALTIALFCAVALVAETITLRGFVLLTGCSVILFWLSLRRAAHAEYRFGRHLEAQIDAEKRRFAAIRLIRRGLERDGEEPTQLEIERRAGALGVRVSVDDYIRESTARTKYLDVIKRTMEDPGGQGDVGFVRSAVQRICLMGIILKSDLAYELLGSISRTVLRIASLAAIFVMALMLVLGFKNIIQALYAETAVVAEAVAPAASAAESMQASASSVTLKSAIKAVEYLLLATLPYLLLVSLTRYVYTITAKDPDAGSTPAELKEEQAEVKAYWVSLLIGVLAASMIEQTLDPTGMADAGQRQKALIVCLVIIVLVIFFLAVKLTAGKGDKEAKEKPAPSRPEEAGEARRSRAEVADEQSRSPSPPPT